jgi:L-ribulokinase
VLLPQYAIGLDYGTESVRAIVVDTTTGRIAGQSTRPYTHGVIDEYLPTNAQKLPTDYALQHPQDWLTDMAAACRKALRASAASPDDIVGIGVDFTSCTMLPVLADGTPLCLTSRFANVPLAWPKLWKHHGASRETDRLNHIARERKEKWLNQYGGVIGIEWFWPKVYETLAGAPDVHRAADVWIEAGDWVIWQLATGPFPRCQTSQLIRSTCQAGYKALWNRKTGYPSPEFFAAVNPKLKNVVADKMPGTLLAPGQRAGTLTPASAKLLGLRPGTPVATAIIDAHSGVPGAGVAEDSTLVLVMGTSSCHMLNSKVARIAPGASGVQDGILPGFYGYETGQSSVGDAFAWLVDTFHLSHSEMTRRAQLLPHGSAGVMAIDWLNGCRTPLMDGRLSGAFLGLSLNTRPEQLYRSLMEATAYGVRRIVDNFRHAGIPVKRFVASGGLPARSPLLMQIYADVLGQTISLAESDQSVALGAAILGSIAAGNKTLPQAIHSMARQRTDLLYRPTPTGKKRYAQLYPLYRDLTNTNAQLPTIMRQLRDFG